MVSARAHPHTLVLACIHHVYPNIRQSRQGDSILIFFSYLGSESTVTNVGAQIVPVLVADSPVHAGFCVLFIYDHLSFEIHPHFLTQAVLGLLYTSCTSAFNLAISLRALIPFNGE